MDVLVGARLPWAGDRDLLAILGLPAWQRDAACKETPDVDFFPGRGESTEPAKAVCRGCLVRDECLAFALDNREQNGIWGGTSERDRRRLRSARAAARRAA